jgi:hypothetical protein
VRWHRCGASHPACAGAPPRIEDVGGESRMAVDRLLPLMRSCAKRSTQRCHAFADALTGRATPGTAPIAPAWPRTVSWNELRSKPAAPAATIVHRRLTPFCVAKRRRATHLPYQAGR